MPWSRFTTLYSANFSFGGMPMFLQQSLTDTLKILKYIGTWQHWRTQVFCLHVYIYVRGISHWVANKWQHRQFMNEDCPHIFGKRYFCSIKFNNFLNFQGSNSNLNGFGTVILFYSTVACRCNYLDKRLNLHWIAMKFKILMTLCPILPHLLFEANI